jgi:cysteinyl-tRNA synthetase, unknown class
MQRDLTQKTAVFCLLVSIIFGLPVMTACDGNGSGGDDNGKGNNDTGATINPNLVQANDFLYQLQDMDLGAMGNAGYDVVIMDYSSNGGADGEYTAQEIATLKQSGKVVLAYISIGEAEPYRYYWDPSWIPGTPDWLGRSNPDWPDNYKVKYWHPKWQNIISAYLTTLVNQGFDGVYLDIIDGYYYWANEAFANGENEQLADDQTAADRMIDFIVTIAGHCRTTANDPHFIVCPQNGTYLIWDGTDANVARYWDVIDAVGAEDTYYFGNRDNDNPLDPQTDIIDNLDEYVTRKKVVFATDYLTAANTTAIDNFYLNCRTKGFLPFATGRDLNELRINTGHDPD